MNFIPKILPYPFMGIQYSYVKRMFYHCENTKISLSPSKAIHHRSPSATSHCLQQQLLPPTSIVCCQPPPLLAAAAHHHPPPSPLSASQLPPPPSRVFLKLYQIFSRIQFVSQILLKYPTQKFFFSEIAFLKILFPIIKIYSIYHTPPY